MVFRYLNEAKRPVIDVWNVTSLESGAPSTSQQ